MNRPPTKAEILDIFQAQSESLGNLSERLVGVEESVEKQESKNQNIVYAVLIAAILILITVATEVLLSNKHDASLFQDWSKDLKENQDKNDSSIDGLQDQVEILEKRLDLLEAKNPYLRI